MSVHFVRIAWELGQQRGGYCCEDKCIVYCGTIEVAEQVAELPCCPLYTSKSGNEAAKEHIVEVTRLGTSNSLGTIDR